MANLASLTLVSASSQYASVADNASLSITGDITIECVVKFTSLPTAGNSAELVSKFLTTGNQRSYRFFLDNTGGTYTLQFTHVNNGTSGEVQTSSSISPSTATWYYFAVSWTAATHTAVFYMGTYPSSAPSSVGTDSTGSQTAIFDGTADFVIGSMANHSVFLDGKLDEVRVSNTVRNGTYITTNWNHELSSPDANVKGYWKLNNDYTDSSGNSSTLTASGSPAFSPDVAFDAPTATGAFLLTFVQ